MRMGCAAFAVLALAWPGLAAPAERRVRFAQFNVWELSRAKLDEVDEAGRGAHPQLRKAAEIIQRVRPDVLLVNEIDVDAAGRNPRLFVERYLAVPQSGQEPVEYPHVYTAEVNTGAPSGLDLDGDGATDGPGDAWGFGRYPGQYGMALLSRLPIDASGVRTFRLLRWEQMPGHLMPDGRGGRPSFYDPDVARRLRLSSKSHWDVPVEVAGTRVHVLAAHPTPPVFDGDEDRNGRRNHDEIRLLADYLEGGAAADWVVDDAGGRGGLAPGSLFVVMGDLNADPLRSDPPTRDAIERLLVMPGVTDPAPTGPGSAGRETPGPPRHLERRTSGFGRLDYVLPCARLHVAGAGVFWPATGDPLRALVEEPSPASDHHLVWVDVRVPDAAQ